MLKIRLQRTGKRGQAYFRLVVTEHITKPKGKYLEFLGSYDPHKNELSVKADRIKHWLSVGAHLSETVNNLLVDRSIIEGEKVKVWKPKPRKHGIEPEAERKLKGTGKKMKEPEETRTEKIEIEGSAPAEETKAQEIPASEEAPRPPEELSKEAIPEEVKTEETAQTATQ